jgi:hypothetical protein
MTETGVVAGRVPTGFVSLASRDAVDDAVESTGKGIHTITNV